MSEADEDATLASKDLAPRSAGTDVLSVINTTGLPSSLRAKAQRLLLQLIGGTVAAPLVSEAREQLDTFAGRSRVNMLLADEVARQAITDPETMERAKARFLGSQFQKQENLEAVASATAEDLAGSSESSEAGSEADIDEDWMNLFVRHAEDASSERLRRLFGKVLAGEIRNPGSFSPAALRTFAELDQETAQDFSMISSLVIGDFVFKSEAWSEGSSFELAIRLEDAGLLTGVTGLLSKTLTINSTSSASLAGKDFGLSFFGHVGTNIQFPCLLLTRVARQLLDVVQTTRDENEQLRLISNKVSKAGLTKIAIGRRVGNQIFYDDVLWSESPIPAPVNFTSAFSFNPLSSGPDAGKP